MSNVRYPPGTKARTRERILASARRALRTGGLRGASVAGVMQGAGLTVGGFYAHFASKQELLGEALRSFMRSARARWLDGLGDLRGQALVDAFLARYLGAENRDSLQRGCLLPSVASELGLRQSPSARVFAEELEALVAAMAPGLGPGSARERRDRALAVVAAAVGALTLARALRETPLSDHVLRATRAFFHEGIAVRRTAGAATDD
ncbi:MAG TPA: TetR/AcrR family transcriptional regulator [Myxococcaceae bacterium]|nr:TetR/AcrR family transcriptional regulator [Myxococcaceae bacterium]